MPSILQRANLAGSLSRFWQGSYAPDYVGLVILIILDGLIQTFVEPFHRMFRTGDPQLQYPHAQVERVPLGWLFAFGLGIPIIVLTIWAVSFRPSLHKIHVTYLGLAISVSLTVFVTDTIKNAVGRPRPDLIARCRPQKDTPQRLLTTPDVCTETNHHILHDGWRSFPSGHSSFAFAGLGFLYFFFAAQFRIFHPNASLPALLITISPILGALLIAISRCEDYRHDVYDVTAGSTLGLLIAWASYRRYYPKLSSSKCESPWPSKGELLAAAMRWNGKKPRDEEALLATHSQRGNGDMRVPNIATGDAESEDDEERSNNTNNNNNIARPRTPIPQAPSPRLGTGGGGATNPAK